MSREYVTTGQVAKLFGVSPRTAANWFDAGRLKGHRLPGRGRGANAGERRYWLSSCVELAEAHGIPITLPPPVRKRKARVA